MIGDRGETRRNARTNKGLNHGNRVPSFDLHHDVERFSRVLLQILDHALIRDLAGLPDGSDLLLPCRKESQRLRVSADEVIPRARENVRRERSALILQLYLNPDLARIRPTA